MSNKKEMPAMHGKKLSGKDELRILHRLMKMMLKQYPWQLPLAGLVIILSSMAGVVGNVFVGQIVIGYYIPGLLGQTGSLTGIWASIFGGLSFEQGMIVMAAVYLVGILSAYLYQVMVSVIGQGFQKRFRDSVFTHMETLPLSYFDTRTHGDIMSIYTNDIDTLREFTSRVLPMVVQSIVTMVIAFIAMISSSWLLTLVVLAFFVVILSVVLYVTHQSARFFIAQQRALGATDGYIEEMISGQKVIKVFNHEEQAKKGFDELNDALCLYTTKASQFSNILGPITNNLGNIQYVVLALIGGISIASGFCLSNDSGASFVAQIGIVVSFLTLGKQFTMPIGQLANQINMINMAMAGGERIFALLDEPSEVDNGYVTLVNAEEGANGEPVEADHRTGKWAWKHPHTEDGTITYTWLKGKINMYDVDFAYVKDKPVLHGITLYAEPGQKVAFVGPTGAGKTTITNLLNRFYDIADGKIRFDDINIKKIKKKDLRRALGMVLQETNLFTGTVKENIRYGNPDATDEEVVEAAKLANADNFIRMLPQGYDTVLHGAGAGLSQGQRQLISIARAACANPPVLVLDEATSSIDSRTEKLVQQGMDAIMKGRTVFVIAHRLSTIQNSDVIMVLEKGSIIERGNHDALLAQKGKYFQLYTGGQVTAAE